MARVAVFSGPILRRNLRAEPSRLSYEFFPAHPGSAKPVLDGFAGALVELGQGGGAATLPALRKALDGKPVGSLSLKCDASTLRRNRSDGFETIKGIFYLGTTKTPTVTGSTIS